MASDFVDVSFIARPNCSLSRKGMVIVVASISLFSSLIAIVFSLFGAWLILPFAGLELVAVGYAFYCVRCHANDYEAIRVDEKNLAIENCDYKKTSQVIMQRYWAQMYLRDQPWGDQSLFLRSHGKEVEIGRRFMNNDQRLQLARQLNRFVGHVH